MDRLAIIGCGAWGGALGIALSDNFSEILLICYNQQESDKIVNTQKILGVKLPKNIKPIANYQLIKDTDAVLIVTPSYAFNETLVKIKPFINKQNIAWATKGFSHGELLHQSFSQIFPDLHPCVISGPSFAAEVAIKQPTALVVASNDHFQQNYWSQAIRSDFMRAYMSDDVIGVEVGGAVKNILAIAAGLIDGLGYSTNTLSALISRGLAEMSRLGAALGADKKTFMGLSGLGDLVLTCFDDKSRNRSFGIDLIKTKNINKSLENIGATVEGLNALNVVLSLAEKHQISMPICLAVNSVIKGDISPEDVIYSLMKRNATTE